MGAEAQQHSNSCLSQCRPAAVVRCCPTGKLHWNLCTAFQFSFSQTDRQTDSLTRSQTPHDERRTDIDTAHHQRAIMTTDNDDDDGGGGDGGGWLSCYCWWWMLLAHVLLLAYITWPRSLSVWLHRSCSIPLMHLFRVISFSVSWFGVIRT